MKLDRSAICNSEAIVPFISENLDKMSDDAYRLIVSRPFNLNPSLEVSGLHVNLNSSSRIVENYLLSLKTPY